MPLGKIGIAKDWEAEVPGGQLGMEIHRCTTLEWRLAAEVY